MVHRKAYYYFYYCYYYFFCPANLCNKKKEIIVGRRVWQSSGLALPLHGNINDTSMTLFLPVRPVPSSRCAATTLRSRFLIAAVFMEMLSLAPQLSSRAWPLLSPLVLESVLKYRWTLALNPRIPPCTLGMEWIMLLRLSENKSLLLGTKTLWKVFSEKLL